MFCRLGSTWQVTSDHQRQFSSCEMGQLYSLGSARGPRNEGEAPSALEMLAATKEVCLEPEF